MLAAQTAQHEAKHAHSLRRSQMHNDLKAQLLAKEHADALATQAAHHAAMHAHHLRRSRLHRDLRAKEQHSGNEGGGAPRLVSGGP